LTVVECKSLLDSQSAFDSTLAGKLAFYAGAQLNLLIAFAVAFC
jgi:hypothetical protein